MFERFTKEARRAVVAAQEEARALGHIHVDTSHLLLAMAGGPDTAARRSLRRLGVNIDALRQEVRSREARAFSGDDAAALRSVGIDLEEVRRSVEDALG